MDDYDGIKNFSGLKYSPFEIFDNFWFIILWGSKYRVKKDCNKNYVLFIMWYTLKDFHPSMQSSSKAKYHALAKGTKEALQWIKQLLQELNMKFEKLIIMLYDNQSAIKMARNPMFIGRTKHVETTCHLVWVMWRTRLSTLALSWSCHVNLNVETILFHVGLGST